MTIKEAIINSLTWFLRNLKSNIVDNCASTSTDLPLSANQGKVLQTNINKKANKKHQHNYECIASTTRFAPGTIGFYDIYENANSQSSRRGYIQWTSGATDFVIKNEVGYIELRNSDNSYMQFSTKYFFPGTTGTIYLGTSGNRWKCVYSVEADNISSDERLKHDIEEIKDLPVVYADNSNEENVFEQLFNKLKPKTYKLNSDNEEDNSKIHIGFVAQDLSASLEELGFSEKDTALLDHTYWTDENTGEEKDTYGLAYTEFIALNTHMIQKCLEKIDMQQHQINELQHQIELLK